MNHDPTPFLYSLVCAGLEVVMDLNKEREAFEENLTDTGLIEFAGYSLDIDEESEAYTHEPTQIAWEYWQIGLSRGLKQAVPEGFVLVPKLSANYLFNKIPELGFKHQDEKDTVLYHLNYMASEFKESAKKFVLLDHEKQKCFVEEESQELSHD